MKENLESKRIAKKVMEFIDNQSFDPVYDEIEKKKKSEDSHAYISEIMRCISIATSGKSSTTRR